MEILFVIVPLFIAVVFVLILVALGKAVAQWSYNNSQPVLSSPARVVSKRLQTSGNMSGHGGAVSTYYYVTFEFETGERQEFSLRGRDYGMLADGDQGMVTYQGTRYRGFERDGRQEHGGH